MIKVNLSSLVHADVGHRESIALDLGSLVFDDLILGYLKGKLNFTRVTYGILCEGVLNAEVEVECVRCLKEFYVPIVIELEDTIRLPGSDLTLEHPVRVTEDDWVDLAPLIREYVWLEIPSKPICSVDCKGICPDCGGNINLGECVCHERSPIDPRWAALRELLENPEKTSN